jgi:2-keto-4-pentenoate hydratase
MSADRLLFDAWMNRTKITALPVLEQPTSRLAAYQLQKALFDRFNDAQIGWKIAATSAAGQAHIRVEGPLAGRLAQNRVLTEDSLIDLKGNIMRVAEAEFILRLGEPLPQKSTPLTEADVAPCLDALFPGIEVPDSRYQDFTVVGAHQLIAEDACADWFVLGAAVLDRWQTLDLTNHEVKAYRNQEEVASGNGARVLDGPLHAATWFANELRAVGFEWLPGQLLATGTCLTPVPVASGDTVTMDFGTLGSVSARFTDSSQ